MLTFGAALFLFASLHNTKKDTTRSLRRTSCSGAFVLLDATVNTRMEGAGYSRAGLYVQKGGTDTPTVPLLLYRGSADVGKTHSVIPHRKWRMEFQTDQFPDYDRWMTPSSTPLYQAYTLTERFSLPGTSEEEVQLFLLPLRGRDGTMYGLCGFEISQSFFKQNFAQPTGFDHLICLFAPADSGLNASAALSSGTTGGYFHAPREMLVLRSMGSSLTQLISSDSAYAGISELCRLSENQSYRLAVCIPMTDYRRLIFSGNLQMLLIGLFIPFLWCSAACTSTSTSSRLRSGSVRRTGGSPGGGWTSCRWSASRCRQSFPGWRTCAATNPSPMPSRPFWRASPT